ncbi:hypothetical protein Bca101_037176 [Brassica carinata]
MYMSKASHLAVPKHQRTPIWTEEAAGFHKRVKRIHDPRKIVVPCTVFEAESPIPPDRSMQISSYIEVLDDHQHVEASQRGLRFRYEVDKGPAEAASIDTDRIPSNHTNKLESNGVRKFKVRSRCFSQPFAKLRALLIAEMIDKGEESKEEAFTQE